MRIRIVFFIFVFCFVQKAIANDQTSGSAIRQAFGSQDFDLNRLYRESQQKARQIEKSPPSKIEDLLPDKDSYKGHKATDLGNLPQLGLEAKEGKKEQEESKIVQKMSCTKDGCDVSGLMSAKVINEREAKYETLGFTKNTEHFPEHNKGYIDTANHKAAEYIKKFNVISGEYSACKANIEDNYTELSTCDQYFDVKYSNCPINQVVEIDPKYTYQCSKKRDEAIKTCTKELESISCRKVDDCDNGGIIAASVKSDMKFEYQYPYLTIGTIADNYWGGSCDTYDRVTEFEIKNKDKITEFLLTDVGFDDYLWIKLNDQTIYVGPDGGSHVEVVGSGWFRQVFNGYGNSYCERKTNWHRGNLNIDLRPYLKEGLNTLFMRVIVAGAGEGWLKIRAKQHCCRDWDIIWKDNCRYEGADA